MYEIGKITTTHGIKGEVKVVNLSDFDRFKKGNEVFIEHEGKRIDLVIENVRNQVRNLIVKFKGYNNINDIIMFRGLMIYSDTRAKLNKNEFYYQDLIDLSVINLDNDLVIGNVKKVRDMPSGPLLEIEGINGEAILIPFISEFIKEVNDGKIYIKPIEGLL